jgi:hypothetical protein
MDDNRDAASPSQQPENTDPGMGPSAADSFLADIGPVGTAVVIALLSVIAALVGVVIWVVFLGDFLAHPI